MCRKRHKGYKVRAAQVSKRSRAGVVSVAGVSNAASIEMKGKGTRRRKSSLSYG